MLYFNQVKGTAKKEMEITMREQFINYLNNQVAQPKDERDIPFDKWQEIKEDSIFLVAISNGTEYKFESNCYFSGVDYDLYSFELYEGAFV